MAGKRVVIIGEVYDPSLGIWGGPGPEQPQPPGIWPSPGYPAHPIAPGGPPPGVWPGPGYPAHPIAPGGPPPGIWPSPGYPAHPIAPGGPPPGIWPSPGRPDQGLPPSGMHPEHPIPPTIWIGPILPPEAPKPDPEKVEWHAAWSAETGWATVGIPTGEAPTPSSTE
jgi:hypothetical protein